VVAKPHTVLTGISEKEKEMARTYYHLFISHSWTYSDAYDGLIRLLNSKVKNGDFSYRDYSVPKTDPIHNTPNQSALKNAIENQISHASAVLIMAGVYSTYSKWINIEIDIAQRLGKPIIAIEPWGSEKTSVIVKNAADRVVKWQANSIVSAIHELA
jgi:hypothetical protein